MRGALLILLVSGVANAAPDVPDVIDKLPDRVAVDWTAGLLEATGAGGADVRAPGVDIARVGAERLARKDATKRLGDAARHLGGVSVSSADLDAVVARARMVSTSYGSDGSVTVVLGVPLESLRKPGATPAASEGAPTAIVIDARAAHGLKPQLGAAIAAGATRYAGPTIWTRDAEVAKNDARVGPRPLAARALSKDATMTVDLDEKTLAAAAAAGAMVVVVIE